MYEFIVYHRGTHLIAGPSIWARSQSEAYRTLRQQEGFTAKAFWLSLAEE
jgi:hypothetical protein